MPISKKEHAVNLFNKMERYGNTKPLQKQLNKLTIPRKLKCLQLVDKHVSSIEKKDERKPVLESFWSPFRKLSSAKTEKQVDTLLNLMDERLSAVDDKDKFDTLVHVEEEFDSMLKLKPNRLTDWLSINSKFVNPVAKEHKLEVHKSIPFVIDSLSKLDDDEFPTAMHILQKHLPTIPDERKARAFKNMFPDLFQVLRSLKA